jgi:hypothetical protein
MRFGPPGGARARRLRRRVQRRHRVADLGRRAFRVGDVVTVILQETTQASKKAGTSFNKGSSWA